MQSVCSNYLLSIICFLNRGAVRLALAIVGFSGVGASSILVVGVVLVIASQVLNAVGVLLEQGVGWYLLGVTSVLGLAAIIFGTIIRTFASSDGGAA